MKISIKELHEKIVTLMREKGLSGTDSNKVSDYLVWAEMSGLAPQTNSKDYTKAQERLNKRGAIEGKNLLGQMLRSIGSYLKIFN